MSWKAPANTGPDITGYDLRYRKRSGGSFTLIQASTGTGTTQHVIAPIDNQDTTNVDLSASRPAPPTRCTCGPRAPKRRQQRPSGQRCRHGEDERR